MKKAIITGITGQDGAYLAQFLLGKGYTVYGLYRRTASTNFWRLDALGLTDHDLLYLEPFDLTDLGSIKTVYYKKNK
ncbi:MAG: GDP-mannose 4,6-dehydratase, partial [Legionellales bacterium]